MLSNWIRSALVRANRPSKQNSKRRPTSLGSRARRPRLDVLEDRCVPAAFKLGSTAFDIAHATAADNAGNIYVVGSFNGTVDFDPGAGTLNLTSTGSEDAFVAKYTSGGNLVWAGQIVDSLAQAVAVDSAGAVHVTGSFGSFGGSTDFDLGAGSSTLTAAITSAYVAKYNPDRSLAWVKPFGGQTSGVRGDAITVDAAGNVYSSGTTSRGIADFDPGTGSFALENTSGNANTYITKLNSSGNFVWAGHFENDPTIAAGVWSAGIGVDAAQNVYLTGIFVSRADFDPTEGGTHWINETGNGGGDGYVVKLTAAGTLAYAVPMGSAAGREDGEGIAVDAAGNAYVTGGFSNTMSIDATAGDTTLTSAGNSDIFVLKLSTTGGLDWARRMGAAGFDGGLGITHDGVDNIYLTGFYSNTVDFDPNGGIRNLTQVGGFTDVFALRLRTDSTFVNAWSLGGSQIEFGNDVAITSGGDVAVVGRFEGTADFDPGAGTLNLTSNGDYDAFVATIAQQANRPPVANDQDVSTNEDTALNGTVTATDPDSDPLTFAVVAAPTHGTLSLNTTTGAFTYTPAANYNGADSFTFKANDGRVDSNVATVSITVNAVNDAPVAVNDAYTVNEDPPGGFVVAAPGVLTNDTDVEGSSLTAVLVAGPANGNVILNANGSFNYRPRFDFTGTDSFTYRARDGALEGNIATVTITINPVNDAPRPTPVIRRVTTNEDTATGGLLTAVDPEGDSFTFSTPPEFAPEHGTVVVNADGTWTYTPAANYYGPDIFGYRITDTHGAEGVGAVEITVAPINDAPIGVNDSYSVNEDGTLVLTASPISRLRMLSEPGDFIGQGLLWDFNPTTAGFSARTNFDNGVEVLVDPPGVVERWTLNFAAIDSVPITPGQYLNATRWPFQEANEPGLDVSGYGRGLNRLKGEFTVYDVGYGTGNTITRFAATFVQQDHNFDDTLEPPLYGAIIFNSTFGAGGGVLANDTDVEGDLLLGATLVDSPIHGDLAFNEDGTFTYEPFPNFHGTDTFTYRTADARDGSGVSTVTITVNPVNDAPVAVNDSAATNEDTALNDTVTATDADGEALTYSVVSGPTNGTLTTFNSSTGAFTYTPNANYHGADSFTFKANDGTVDSNTATFAITVNSVNDVPVANNQSFTTNEDTPHSGTVTATDADGDTLTFALVAGPAHGTVTLNSNGSFTYTPDANYNGADSFTFKANDGTADSNTATVSITVTAVNDVPVAVDDTATTDEDTAVTINVLVNDTDADGDALTPVLVSGTTNGTLTLNANGTFTYLPNNNFNGTDSFTYKVTDGTAESNVATVTIRVRGVNNAPVANNQSFTTDEDTAHSGNVTATDVDGDALTFLLVAGPAHGTVSLNSNGSFTYTPAANYNGADSFTFKANDGTADSNVATVSITVNAVNDAPVAVNDSATTNEDTALNDTVTATDADGDALTYSVVSGPTNGTLTTFNSSTGAFTYTPNANYQGSDSFTFKANDGTVDSNTATFAIAVNSVNDAPVANNQSFTTDEDTAHTGTVTATDADGDTLTFALVAGPAHGTVTLDSNGSFTYTPDANYNGSDSFTFKANDGTADSNVATVSITVTAVNDAPIAVNDRATTNEDTAVTISVLANDIDVDGNALTPVLVSGTTNGTLTLNANGTFSYLPSSNFHGADSFTYKVTDGSAESNVATVTIAVQSVNDAPVANNGSFSTNEDTAHSGTVTATDVDGDPLTFALVAGPAHGTVTIIANGSFTYTPAANYNGSDSFTFKANDGTADSNTATVAITVNAINDAPVAVDDNASTNEDTAVTIGVLTNDTDVDGDTLTVSAVTQPGHGAVVVNANGTVTYTPAANYNGTDSFTYTASDGHGGTDTATVSLTVGSVNDAPVAVNDTAATDEDTAVTINVLANDTDADGDALMPVLVSPPSHGTVVLNANGTFTYTPAANYNGTDSFTYRATDGSLNSNVAGVAITVRAVNDAPVAVDDTYSTTQNGVLNVPAAGVLANDTDVDGNTLSAVLASDPANGTVTLNSDGSFRYTPNNGFIGSDSFTYHVNDGTVDSNKATVTIQVAPTGNTEGKVTAAGYIDRGKRLFAMEVQSKPRGGELRMSGHLKFVDLKNGILLRSKSITSFNVDATGKNAVITGTANVNGKSGYTYTVMVSDVRDPGRKHDTFRILISGPNGFAYDSLTHALNNGILDSGNIKVRKKA